MAFFLKTKLNLNGKKQEHMLGLNFIENKLFRVEMRQIAFAFDQSES